MRLFDRIFLYLAIGLSALLIGFYVWTSMQTVTITMPTNLEKHDKELSRSHASPKALKVFTEDFWWDCTDDNSPFGNDNGADALSLYYEWRKTNPGGDPVVFVQDLLLRFQAPFPRWQSINPNTPLGFIVGQGYVMETGDECIIAVAFGQFLYDGRVDPALHKLALKAINNEKMPNRLKHWVDPKARLERLAKMEKVLNSI